MRTYRKTNMISFVLCQTCREEDIVEVGCLVKEK